MKYRDLFFFPERKDHIREKKEDTICPPYFFPGKKEGIEKSIKQKDFLSLCNFKLLCYILK